MVTIKDGCGCDPCDCDWKQKLKEAYARASVSVNKIGDYDGSVYFPDGSGFVKIPIPKLSEVQQISTNSQDIADLKVQDIQLQADITAETAAREEAIADEASAREAAITAEATAREEAIAAEASARESKDTELDANIARIDNTDAGQDQRIQDNADRITSTYNDLVSTEATVATHDSEIITLQAQTQSLSKSLVSDVMMTDGTTAGSVQVSIEREDGSLITSANYRWGRDIGIRLEAGTQAGYVKAVISLSDGTELVSNEYKIVEVLESDVYVTAITLIADQAAGTLGGNISYSNGTTQTINSVSVPTAPGVTSAIETLQTRMTAVEQKNTTQDSQISAIDGRVQALENVPVIEQFAAGKLGTIAGSSIDGRVKAENDGTGSVNGWSDLKGRMTAVEQKNDTQDASITAIDGRVQALENTPAIGQFANGRLGTIAGSTTDGRIKAENNGTGSVNGWSDLKGRVSTAEGQIVAVQGDISSIDSEISGIMTDISGLESSKVNVAQGAANAGKVLGIGSDGNVTPTEMSAGGEVWEEVNLSNFPTDWVAGDIIRFIPYEVNARFTVSSWNTKPSQSESGLTVDKNYYSPMITIPIPSSGSNSFALTISAHQSTTYIDFRRGAVNKSDYFNSDGGIMIGFSHIALNGGGYSYITDGPTRNNVSDYIYKMWRLKK